MSGNRSLFLPWLPDTTAAKGSHLGVPFAFLINQEDANTATQPEPDFSDRQGATKTPCTGWVSPSDITAEAHAEALARIIAPDPSLPALHDAPN